MVCHSTSLDIRKTAADRHSAFWGFGSDTTAKEMDTQFTPPASPLQGIVHHAEELLSMVKMANLELSEKDHAEKGRLRAEIKALEKEISVVQYEQNMANRTLEIEKAELEETIIDMNRSLEQSTKSVKTLEESVATLSQSLEQAQASVKTMEAKQKKKAKTEQKKEAKLKALKELVGGL